METATKTITRWNLDPAHSEITFKVEHMMITNVSGSFQNFSVNAETEGQDFTKSRISFTADIDSVTTGNSDRDNHLKSADFLNAEANPQIRFVSKAFEVEDQTDYLLLGDLTIKGITKPVRLDVAFGGIAKDPWENQKTGLH